MATFAYRAKKGPTEIIDGSLEAASAEEVVERLDEMGLIAVRVQEVAEAKPAEKEESSRPKIEKKPKSPSPKGQASAKDETPVSRTSGSSLPVFSRIRSSEITLFGRQMASLLKSGVPILRALWIIGEQTSNPAFRSLLEEAQRQINNGRSFSSVLAEHPKQFPPLYVAMVRMGEDSGNLQEAMLRISDYRQKQEEILSRVRTAMAYPILMGLTGIGTIIFMLTYVIPKLTALFSSLGTSLPAPTRILMAVSAMLQRPLLWAVLAGLGLSTAVLLRARSQDAKWLWSVLSLRIPVVRGFVMKAELARFSRTLELLIQSGLPILRAIETAIPVMDNLVYRRQLAKAQEDLTGGGSLGKSMRACGVFPLFMTNLISVAEESGKLDEAMQEIAGFYERETDEQIRIMTSLMEPLMILVMGAIVGFIVMAMMLPMFELNLIVK